MRLASSRARSGATGGSGPIRSSRLRCSGSVSRGCSCSCVAGELAWCGEAVDVAELGGDRVGEHPADPGDGAEQRDVAVVGAKAAQLAFAAADLVVELVDQAQAGLDRALPRLGQREAGQELAAAHTEQIGDWAGLAVREQ